MKEIDQIREGADLVKLIREYIKLKKRGNKFIGDCSFCKAKNTFTVDGKKNLFHCFSCGKGGDVFTFVMEKLGRSFPGAVQWLSEKYEIKIVEDDLNNLKVNMNNFQEKLTACFDSWLSGEMKDKEFIFKMSTMIKIGPEDEEVKIPF